MKKDKIILIIVVVVIILIALGFYYYDRVYLGPPVGEIEIDTVGDNFQQYCTLPNPGECGSAIKNTLEECDAGCFNRYCGSTSTKRGGTTIAGPNKCADETAHSNCVDFCWNECYKAYYLQYNCGPWPEGDDVPDTGGTTGALA